MKLPPLFFSVMDKVKELLEDNKPLGKQTWTNPEIEKINELIPECITTKPMVYLINISKSNYLKGGNKHLPKVKEFVEANGGGLILPFSIEWEEEYKAYQKTGDTAACEEMVAATNGRGSVLPRIVKCG